MEYLVKRNKGFEQITYMVYDAEGYQFKPENTFDYSCIRVNTVTFYKPDLVNHLIVKRFKQQFNRLSGIIFRFLESEPDDDSDTDCMLLLDDVERLRRAMELNYQRYLENREYIQYIHELAYLDNQIRQKLAYINQLKQMEYQSSHTRSR